MPERPHRSGASPSATIAVTGAAADAVAGPAAPSRLTLDVLVEGGDWIALGAVEILIARAGHALAMHPASGLPPGPIAATIMLHDDAALRALNLKFRGHDKPTNVLAFPAGATPLPTGAQRSLGDIAIAWETVQREAQDLAIPATNHLQHLVVHALLHLAGFDHLTVRDATRMEQLETEILAGLGIPDPYAGSTPHDLPDRQPSEPRR
jgi:probable rRNA maturation factor